MVNALTAYIDPGSGSLLLQALVGGAAAAGVVARLYWKRFVTFLRPGRSDDAA